MSELQEHLKQAPRIEHADRPLVFFKIGALGALPLDFPEALAQQYDIPMISSDEIRKDLIEERDRRGLPPKTAQRINLKRIQTIVRDEARESLEDNEDLVIDMFANSPKSRGPIRSIAKDTGAIAVGLWANASYKTITDRVTQWTEKDSFVVPVNRWEASPVSIARNMMGHIQRPAPHEDMYSFYLDGEADTNGLLEQVESYFHRTGLMDRFVDVDA